MATSNRNEATQSENTETQEGNTLAAIFADQSNVFTKQVFGYTIPVRPRHVAGTPMTEAEARYLNTYELERAAATANSNAERGSWKDLPDDEKRAKIIEYLATQRPSEDAGSMWGASLVHQAMHNILAELPRNKEKLNGMAPSDAREALRPLVVKALNDPNATERYREPVAAEMNKILATRHERKKRGTKTEDGSPDLGLDY